MEKIVQHEGKTYLVTVRRKRTLGHPYLDHQYEYALFEERPVTIKRWFRPPTTRMVWTELSTSEEDREPHTLEEFMKQARELIQSYYRHIDFIERCAAQDKKFAHDFQTWDGNLG